MLTAHDDVLYLHFIAARPPLEWRHAMTDAEKELRRHASKVLTWGVGDQIGSVARDLAADVLALLERIDALEKACVAAHSELFNGGGARDAASAAEHILSEVIP